MPHDPSRIAYLLQRYTSRTCSREELEELFRYIERADAGDDAVLQQLMEDAWQGAHLQEGRPVPEIDYEDVYERIVRPAHPQRSRLFTLRRVAAAAVLLLAGAAFWLWRSGDRQKVSVPVAGHVPHTGDVTPGLHKAILTLADGSSVTLDSAGNQVIQQGPTAIRQQNGQLLYASQGGDESVRYNKLSTPRGGQFSIVLPDGTKVWLNSASALRYPTAFTGNQRIVELQGQAYFEVAQNAAQPFKVMVGEMEVQVLGTDFDVMAYPDEATVNTTLLSGSVQVKEGEALQLLRPGQQAVLRNSDHAITVRTADIKKVVAWKDGLFVFNNMTLPAILREVARWYDVEIVYTVQPSQELYGGGISRRLPLSGILNLLEGNGHNHFRIEGRKVIVLP
ncbi:FecR family protein [Chitinophaga japonensis]|uniref:FecR family protein n=1 Tax=Chitinophaga japonensis TaxID=104662 RepID=A0A562TBY5_CHIJA|nr:FecR family protein [Chitinophaga japonensis]TWI91022.1 FecR family protein [Chitinophaga japonensis]